MVTRRHPPGDVRGPRNITPIHVTALDGRTILLSTRRSGTNLDPAWSPDGRRIVFVGCPQAVCFERDYEIYSMPAAGGPAQRHTFDRLRDHDPYYSPDGKTLAWLTQFSAVPMVWDIRLAASSGGPARRLVGDRAVNSRPEWSRDGRTIFFHRLDPSVRRFQLFRISPDGTGLRRLTERPQPGVNQYPSA